jgi:hypothetical protein
MYKVINNFVTDSYATILENMCKKEIPWYLDDNISGTDETNSPNYKKYKAPGADYSGNQYGFYHFALDQNGNKSQFFEKVLPLVYSLEEKAKITMKELYRIRIALSTSVGKEVQHYPHVDLREPHKVLLYYVNDSDGDTFMFNEIYNDDEKELKTFTLKERVAPEKNKAIIFDGLRYHNSSKPVKNTARYIINMDFN